MQSMKRAASGAKAARKKVRTTAASGARAARKKVRTQVHGCRVWVWPCDKENVEVALKQKREGKKSWTAEAWKTCVDQEMKTNLHGRAALTTTAQIRTARTTTREAITTKTPTTTMTPTTTRAAKITITTPQPFPIESRGVHCCDAGGADERSSVRSRPGSQWRLPSSP